MIHYIKRWSILFHLLQGIHQKKEILCVVEIAGTDILKFDNDSIQADQIIFGKLYMVCERSELSIPWRENDLKVSSLMKYVIKVSPLFSIPTVLGTKTADSAFQQSLIKLFF